MLCWIASSKHFDNNAYLKCYTVLYQGDTKYLTTFFYDVKFLNLYVVANLCVLSFRNEPYRHHSSTNLFPWQVTVINPLCIIGFCWFWKRFSKKFFPAVSALCTACNFSDKCYIISFACFYSFEEVSNINL